ncbi:MAG: stage III sporulation protein AA [bacterium]|nr:stage III sporulation protein AA [bacterium]
MEHSILQLFPAARRPFWGRTASCQKELKEIRLRAERPIVVHTGAGEVYLDRDGRFTDRLCDARHASAGELKELLEHICRYSVYAFEDELRQGFITVSGGHRVGLAGQVVSCGKDGIRTIRNICFVNIRISHEVKGAADGVLPRAYRKGRLKSILIVSPPGCGKTTLLRDLVRQVSDGNDYGRGMTVGVVDERSEIAGSYCGMPQNDVGMRTDVLDACPKSLGMMLLLRSMSPEVIAIDELGSRAELEALQNAAACGSRILATAHGEGTEDIRARFGLPDRVWDQLFDMSIVLGKENGNCVVKRIVEGGGKDA